MTKRVFTLVLALCLLCGALAGCGKKDEKNANSSSSSQPVSTVSTPVATASPAPVQKAKAVKVKADGGLNVRSKPSTDSEALGLADNGSKLPLLVETASDGWYQVEYEGKTAYVSAEYAEVVEVSLEEYNKLKAGDGDTSAVSSESGDNDDPGRVSSSSKPESSAVSVGNEDGE